MVIVETYPGNGRIKLPLHEFKSMEEVNGSNYEKFETRSDALKEAFKQEHRKFPDIHNNSPVVRCPSCCNPPEGWTYWDVMGLLNKIKTGIA